MFGTSCDLFDWNITQFILRGRLAQKLSGRDFGCFVQKEMIDKAIVPGEAWLLHTVQQSCFVSGHILIDYGMLQIL